MTWLRPDLEQNERHAEDCQTDNMVRIPGGTFRMGSDHHDPEEAPAHRVTVDGFWIDCTPVTNRQFKRFVIATGHKTTAEIPPDPKDYRPHCRTCFMPARRTIVAAIALRRVMPSRSIRPRAASDSAA